MNERREDQYDNMITLLLTYFVFHVAQWWGGKYEAAQEKSQKFKEGKFILERFLILGPNGSNYSITLETQIGGSDADDA
ncbi:unnamed protein product [Prunus armeniaca]|uniref:Yippee domain-containing protein n=1 Tax=Prunus armeniaca TaxID=36596 RepID=A0A6J5X2I7_PRUAR|nr:unnamed protein product [Prunus armeniaca]